MRIYVLEAGARVCRRGGRIEIAGKDQPPISYPSESVESMVLSASVQMTSQCLTELSENGVCISWVDALGKVVGTVIDPHHQDVDKQRRQFFLTQDEAFCLALARKFVQGKIANQATYLYKRVKEQQIPEVVLIIEEIRGILKKVARSGNLEELKGIEGYAARKYYEGMRFFLPEGFPFIKRIKNPPPDFVNSLLSFAYHLLFHDIFLTVHQAGYHPYLGFLHQFRQGHPALVSDLMEEWRTMTADAVVVALLRQEKLREDDFCRAENGGVYLRGSARKAFIAAYEHKIAGRCFFHQAGVKNTFRGGFSAQLHGLAKALQSGDPDAYEMVIAR